MTDTINGAEPPKPDLAGAEAILFEAQMRALNECGLKADWGLFMIASQRATCKILAKAVSAEMLERDNGRKFIAGVLKQFEIMLVQDINARLVLEAHKKAFPT